MDEKITKLGEKGAVFVSVKAERKKRAELERIPKPEKTVSLKDWALEMEKIFGAEVEKRARDVVSSAHAEVVSVFGVEIFRETVTKKLMAQPLELRWRLLPLVQKMAEDVIFSKQLEDWEGRFKGVDQAIRHLESQYPKEFSMALLNTHKDFPENRVGFADNKPYDLWLTTLMGEKKPVFFLPYENWAEKMGEFYSKVYLREFEKERQPIPPPPVEIPASEPVHRDGTPSPELLRKEFFQLGEESPPSLQERINRKRGVR